MKTKKNENNPPEENKENAKISVPSAAEESYE
jgi:hypothetical protein